MKKQDDGPPVAVDKAYDFVLWLLPKVENFSGEIRCLPRIALPNALLLWGKDHTQ
jgi:hypothetical protein